MRPDPVGPAAQAQLSVSATHSLDLPLTYLVGSELSPDLASAGSFAPGPGVCRTRSGRPLTIRPPPSACVLQVTVSDTLGHSTTGTFTAHVDPVNVITIAGGSGSQTAPIDSGASMGLQASASDLLGRPLTYTWSASCPGLPGSGTFVPGPVVQEPDVAGSGQRHRGAAERRDHGDGR